MLDQKKKTLTLDDFKRDAEGFVKELKESGKPLMLTVKNEELVVLDATTFRKILDRLDYLETIESIQKGMDAFERGEHRPAKEALEEMRKQYEIPR